MSDNFQSVCSLSRSQVLMIRGREGYGDVLEFNRPSGICCDDKGLFALADSKNQRVLVYNSTIEFQYAVIF